MVIFHHVFGSSHPFYDLTFIVITSTINFGYQHFTCFIKTITGKLPFFIPQQLLILHSFVDYLLLTKFIEAYYTYRPVFTKDNFFILDESVFDGFFEISSRHETSIFNSFVSRKEHDNLLIHFPFNHQPGYQKFFFASKFCTVALLTFYISIFTHFHI